MSKTLSNHALVANLIRAELKAKFPAVKFSVKSESGAGGTNVRVYWENGPTSASVDEIIDKFQDSDFDGMTDSTNRRDDIHWVGKTGKLEKIPRVRFTFANRTISDAMYKAIATQICNLYNIEFEQVDQWVPQANEYLHTLVHRTLVHVDLTTKAIDDIKVNFIGVMA